MSDDPQEQQDSKRPAVQLIQNPYKKAKVVHVQPTSTAAATAAAKTESEAGVSVSVHDDVVSSPSGSSGSTKTTTAITPDQRRQLVHSQATREREENVATAAAASDGETASGMVTPIKHTKPKPKSEENQQNKRLSSNSSPSSSLTPEQKELIQANRQRALQLRQERERQERLLARCPRCHEPSDNRQLCVVWRHADPHLEKQRSAVGKIFCSPCCRRIDPQPCYIGTHLPPSLREEDVESSSPAAISAAATTTTGSVAGLQTIVRCACGEMARFQRTRKQGGLNHGRYYYRCWVPPGNQPHCDFFQWADHTHGLPVYRPPAATDGVAEWLHPHADPLGEDLSRRRFAGVVHREQARQRLTASVLVRQMVLEVTTGPFVQYLQTVPQLRDKVNQVLLGGSAAIVKHLHPLTGAQIHQRLGDVDDGGGVAAPLSMDECSDLLDQVVRRNPVLRATVRRLDRTWVDLQYLGNYYAV